MDIEEGVGGGGGVEGKGIGVHTGLHTGLHTQGMFERFYHFIVATKALGVSGLLG